MVEHSAAAVPQFGRGETRRMTVRAFVHQLAAPACRAYLTTQEPDIDSDGHPRVATPPLDAVPGVPLKPAAAGALVPAAVNVWVGRSASGASSGLHHDFHDNIYCLLQGRKRFRLFPPGLARRMFTHGQIQHVHENGRRVHTCNLPQYLATGRSHHSKLQVQTHYVHTAEVAS